MTELDATIVGIIMSPEVKIREGESQDSLLRRFQRAVQINGVLREAKAKRRFISKRDAARIKAKKNSRRRQRQGNNIPKRNT